MNAEEVFDALKQVQQAREDSVIAVERAITDRISELEGPRGHETVARAKADINSLIATVNAALRELEVQSKAIVTLGQAVIESGQR
ncbi:hypothetical protein ACMZ29_00510 [Brevibacterium casei]|uniref:hypothetical protein n=1 Tax=Brevibacterium casei TaxID=33889 RepID=UPI0039EFF21A